MKIILLKDVENLGKKYDVKEVKDGYARNFLFAKKLAKIANTESLKWLEKELASKEQKAAESLEKIGKTASSMEGLEIEIPVKIGDKGQFFEKLNAQKISARLAELGYEIKKNQVELKQEITEVGEYEAKIKFEHGLEATIKIIIAEKSE